jgi:hypothetical protein
MHLLTARFLAVAGAVVAFTAGPAAAGAVAVTPVSAHAGEEVVISGILPLAARRHCAPVLSSAPAFFPPGGTGPKLPTAAGGVFRIRYVVPAGVRSGAYRVGVRCRGRDVGRAVAVRVTAQDEPVPAVAPAGRHRSTGPWWVAAGVLLIGIAAFLGVAEWRPWRHWRI